MRNAKIVCTLGPASADRETVRALADAGMTVARINASHGTREDRAALIDRVRTVDEATPGPVSVMLDLQGPEIRTATIESPVTLETDSDVRFVEGDEATPETIGVSVPLDAVSEGDRVLLDDGRIETRVLRVEDDAVVAHVESGGRLGSRRGVNVPGVDLGLDVVTDGDRDELELGAEKDVDFVAASFVRSGADVLEVEGVLEGFGAAIPVVAKVEKVEAVRNIEGVIDAAYGVMVARGDLGVECPMEDVPMIQKRIIRRCVAAGVPVITATEMLDSMIHQRRPTRAEASDVANAILDGTDAVMLSGETAIGDHPAAVVETMARIIRRVEESAEYEGVLEGLVPDTVGTGTDALARSARYLARDIGARAIVVASESGYTALKTAKFRPGVPTIATTPNDRVRRQLALSWGVNPQYAVLAAEGPGGVIENAVQAALEAELVDSGDTVVVLSGMMTELDLSTTNTLKVHVAAETVAAGRGVVAGRAVGPLYRAPTGDLADLPEGAIVCLPADFDDEFTGGLDRIGGLVDAHEGMTGYAAMIARELDVPMVGGAAVPDDFSDGATVTIDGERGVVYAGDVTARPDEP